MQQKQRVVETVRRITQIEKRCGRCQKNFWGVRKATHCSSPCYQADYREQHREELRAANARYYRERKAARAVSS